VSSRLRAEPLKRRPTVTVVIPCYNYGHYLPTALTSVLKQAGVNVEVIVIDDASPDGSAAVVRELAAGDDRVRPILHRRNRGHIATYNEGLDQANGDYIVLLSADDALTPGALARATALLEAQPSVGLVYGHPIVFVDELPRVTLQVRNWTIWSGDEWIERRCRTGRNCIMNPEVVMRASVWQAIGGYDPTLPHSGDFEMWLRAATVSDVGRVNGSAQAFYRIHLNSMQRTTYAGHAIDLEGRLAAFQKLLVGPGARVANDEALFASAQRALASSAVECARSAYDHGRATHEPVDDYMVFAAGVWPGVRRSRKYRAIVRRASTDRRRLDRGLGPIARRVAEDVRWRVRWRRWRWTGV
jgi:glycosyltransferase involved in cell wall biosynthesis